MEDITELTNSLVDLFPAVKAAQKDLCEAESVVQGQSAEVESLKEIIEQQDDLL